MTNDPGAPGAPYPGYPPPPPAHQAPRRKGGCMRMIGIATVAVVGLVVVIAVVAIAAGGGDDDENGDTSTGTTEASDTTADEGPVSGSDNEENPPADDVEVTECGPGVGNPAGGNFAGAAGRITNHSSEASTYLGNVEFVDGAGTRYAESPLSSSAVAPGQAVEFNAPTIEEFREGTECRLAQIERFAS